NVTVPELLALVTMDPALHGQIVNLKDAVNALNREGLIKADKKLLVKALVARQSATKRAKGALKPGEIRFTREIQAAAREELMGTLSQRGGKNLSPALR